MLSESNQQKLKQAINKHQFGHAEAYLHRGRAKVFAYPSMLLKTTNMQEVLVLVAIQI